jgi:CDP-glucose 4,6-dehydratase
MSDHAAPFGGVFKGARVLITGHTGFKGSWLANWLVGLGSEVAGYSLDIPTEPSLHTLSGLGRRIADHRGDIRDTAKFQALVESFKPDFVFHLAAQAIVSTSYADPVETMSTNVVGTASVLQALRPITHPCVAVIITSDKCYDNVEWPWGYRETDALGGKDVYSGSKGAAELVFRSFWYSFFKAEHPVRLATTRAGNVIGGGDWAADRIVADCVRAWQAGRKVQIRSPAATRPWQHVLEPLSGYLTLAQAMRAQQDLSGESFNFGPRAEQNARVIDLLGDLGRVWGLNEADSYDVTGNIPFHEAGLLKLNCDKALLRLRWQPTLSYEECVSMTGGWYRDVVRDGGDAHDATQANIATYERLAADRHQVWA